MPFGRLLFHSKLYGLRPPKVVALSKACEPLQIVWSGLTVIFGRLFTVISNLLVLVQPSPSLAISVYVPLMSGVALALVGLAWLLPKNPFGPVQLYVIRGLALVVIKLSTAPTQTGELLDTEAVEAVGCPISIFLITAIQPLTSVA